MKNSASNSSIKQASSAQQVLKEQSAPLLPALTDSLAALGYSEICHQRISQQESTYQNGNQQHHIKAFSYQGLTRAQHLQFGYVMIKWELNSASNNASSHLSHEMVVLQALNKAQQTQVQNNIESIVPPILVYDTLIVNVLNLSQQLTILVMPYYKNGSLAHYLCQPLEDKQKYQLIVQAAHLIANLHNNGWLHNDTKPSNILLSEHQTLSADNKIVTPTLLLTDFALAQPPDKVYSIDAAGTPAYLAPERWQGQGATQQSDIYAFGIMMYEVLMGTRPFKIPLQSSERSKDWAIEHCQKPIPILPKEYQYYQDITDKALAKRVERRYKSMEEVLESLLLLEI